tara:strand:+ start:1672 stop:1827 length:156 start_codon:yes stop_codon:yes gene_type:complete
MGFIQKLASRNTKRVKKDIEQPNYIVKQNTLYEKVKGKKKNIFYYFNPKNW